MNISPFFWLLKKSTYSFFSCYSSSQSFRDHCKIHCNKYKLGNIQILRHEKSNIRPPPAHLKSYRKFLKNFSYVITVIYWICNVCILSVTNTDEKYSSTMYLTFIV